MLVGLVVYALVVTLFAALFSRKGESFASSFGWWLLAMPSGLAVYAALELFGSWGLGLPFWQRMPSWARIVLLVLLISIGTASAVFLGQHFEAGSAA